MDAIQAFRQYRWYVADDAFLYQVKTYLASLGWSGMFPFRIKRPVKGFLLRNKWTETLYVEEANEWVFSREEIQS